MRSTPVKKCVVCATVPSFLAPILAPTMRAAHRDPDGVTNGIDHLSFLAIDSSEVGAPMRLYHLVRCDQVHVYP